MFVAHGNRDCRLVAPLMALACASQSTLGSVGHELVHQMSLGRVKVNPAHIQDGAALRDRDSPVVQRERAAAGAGGGVRQVCIRHGAGVVCRSHSASPCHCSRDMVVAAASPCVRWRTTMTAGQSIARTNRPLLHTRNRRAGLAEGMARLARHSRGMVHQCQCRGSTWNAVAWPLQLCSANPRRVPLALRAVVQRESTHMAGLAAQAVVAAAVACALPARVAAAEVRKAFHPVASPTIVDRRALVAAPLEADTRKTLSVPMAPRTEKAVRLVCHGPTRVPCWPSPWAWMRMLCCTTRKA